MMIIHWMRVVEMIRMGLLGELGWLSIEVMSIGLMAEFDCLNAEMMRIGLEVYFW
jgi:hypothetical protein